MDSTKLNRSPFDIQRFRSQFNNQGVKVGVKSRNGLKEDSFRSKGANAVADVVYQAGSPAERILKEVTAVEQPTLVS